VVTLHLPEIHAVSVSSWCALCCRLWTLCCVLLAKWLARASWSLTKPQASVLEEPGFSSVKRNHKLIETHRRTPRDTDGLTFLFQTQRFKRIIFILVSNAFW